MLYLAVVSSYTCVLTVCAGICRREKAVKDLLWRSAPQLDEWMTRGIVGSLKIPMAWVSEAKVRYISVLHFHGFLTISRQYMHSIKWIYSRPMSSSSLLGCITMHMTSRCWS